MRRLTPTDHWRRRHRSFRELNRSCKTSTQFAWFPTEVCARRSDDRARVHRISLSLIVPHGRTSFGVRLRKTSKEHIALIELQCDQARVYVRSERSSHPRRFRLRRISTSTSRTHSYDLTSLLNNRRQRLVYLIFDQPMYKSSLSIVYYSESSRNLFSFSSMQHAKRRFRRTILPESPSSTCAKHEYEIDFNQFSFGQWIVQPKRFNAYVCSGSCPNPLSPQYFPSNHAILISLMSSQRPSGQQQPLCVPVQLKPLCLLYYDRDELVIKYHQDMIVQECGCR